MQFSAIPQHIVDRVVDRRGALHIHQNIDPTKTALVVIDLQNCFMVEELAFAYSCGAIKLVPIVNRVADEVRRAGGKVFWIRNTISEDMRENWSNWFAMNGYDPERAARREVNMIVGSPGHQIHSDLVIAPQDEIVDKHRFSAFIQGSSDIDDRLRAQGIDTLIFAGIATNVCCESSARDAMMLNYKVIVVTDATAAATEEEQLASLSIIYSNFGDVMEADMVVACLRNGAERLSAGNAEVHAAPNG
uniref:Isochorismatase hydrolase n=1 Tax=Chelativorans sp. (strain BNC1) TaxID=266779 RepID=Q11FY1_CHESB